MHQPSTALQAVPSALLLLASSQDTTSSFNEATRTPRGEELRRWLRGPRTARGLSSACPAWLAG
eukprot:12876956-Alexandrium_andersonii.AAC.1